MNTNSPTILVVKDICNRYEGTPLLRHVGFSMAQGEILCLLGPSGSGKTTLLKLIAGLEDKESGTIAFGGEDISATPPYKRNFGMMFQEYALFPHKNVVQNIAFGLEMQKCGATEQQNRIDRVVSLVGLDGFEKRRIDELSGGERQRVALARSLAPQPRLLLLDEPLGSLDRALRDRLTGEIRTILKTLGVTAIFVTHDQAEAFSIGDRVGVLHQGRLQQIDTPENLYRRPSNITVARFLGFENLLQGHFDGECTFHGPFGAIPLGKAPRREAGPATLLIRPDGANLVNACAAGSASCTARVINGKVIRRQFHGSRYSLKVECGATALRFELPLDPPPPKTEETVTLAIQPSALVLLDTQENI